MMSKRGRSNPAFVVAAEVVLHAVIIVCPLSAGGAPRWVLWPLVLLSLLAMSLVLVDAVKSKRVLQLPIVAVVPLVIAATCLLQLLPLPGSVLGLMSPFAGTLREFALLPLELARPRPVTLDVASTWRELAKALSYAFVLFATVTVCRSRRATRRIVTTVALTGTLVAVMSLCHRFIGGAWLSADGTGSAWSWLRPFANANHMSGYLTLSALAALGVGFAEGDRPRLMLWVCAATACAGAVYSSGSRGGAACLTAAVCVFFIAQWLRRAREHAGRRAAADIVIAGLALTAVVGVGAYLGWETLVPRLDTVSTIEKLQRTKVELWPPMARAALEFWPLGMGRGAYELGFTAFQPVEPTVVFTHPENVVLQLLSELGVPIAGVVLALAALVLWRLMRASTKGPLEAAVFAALVGIALHDCVDFALELPGTAIAAAALCGTAFAAGPHREVHVRAAAGVGVMLAALAIVGAALSRPDFRDAESELQAMERAGVMPYELEARARQLVDRHPADYVLYLITARAMSTPAGQPQLALAWVNRAFLTRPIDPEAHRIAARALMRLGRRPQAMLEYRLAGALAEGVRLAKRIEELEILSVEPRNRFVVAHELIRRGRRAEAEAIAAAAPDESSSLDVLMLAASLAMDRKDLDGAAAHLARAARLVPESGTVTAAQAHLLAQKGDREGAVTMLRALTIKHPEEFGYAHALATLLLQMGRPREARDALSRVSPFVVDQGQRAQKMMLDALCYEAERSWSKAISSYESAARLAPTTEQPHLAAAVLYEKMGKLEEAQRSIHAAVRAAGGQLSDDKRAWIERLQKAASERDARLVTPPPESADTHTFDE